MYVILTLSFVGLDKRFSWLSLFNWRSFLVCSIAFSKASFPLVSDFISSLVSSRLSLSFATTPLTSRVYLWISSLLNCATVSLKWGSGSIERPISQFLSLFCTIVCDNFIPFKVLFRHDSGPIVVAAFVPIILPVYATILVYQKRNDSSVILLSHFENQSDSMLWRRVSHWVSLGYQVSHTSGQYLTLDPINKKLLEK